MKHTFFLFLVGSIILCVTSVIVSLRQNARLAAEQATVATQRADLEARNKFAKTQAQSPAPQISPPEPVAAPQTVPSVVAIAPSETAPKTPAVPKIKIAKNAPNQSQPKKPKEWVDPDARLALFFVGADPACEEYWAMAINDPTLPANERQDLIEDLNEEGFPDPKNLTREDLPLILSRIELIENHGPYAMDDVNTEAFLEAYKDLLNMAARAAR